MWYVERWHSDAVGFVEARRGPFETEEAAKADCPVRWVVRYSKEPLEVGTNPLDN